MAERIYLQEWFYNAGIVGLLRLLGGETVEGERLLNRDGLSIEGVKIGENYVEVEKELFKDFAKKYYLEAAKREVENSGIDELRVVDDAEALKKLRDKLKNLIKRLFPHLQGQVKLPSRVSQKNLQEAKELLEKALIGLKEEKEKLVRGELPVELLESAGKAWLSRGFFSSGGSKKLYEGYENLREKVEEPLLLSEEKPLKIKKTEVPCLLCQERLAQDGLGLSKAISDLVGFNKDNINLVHLLGKRLANKGLPVCSTCQAVVSSLPLGVIRFNNSFLFANTTTSVRELFKDNQRLRGLLSSSSPFFEFFAQKVLEKESQSAKFISLLGTSIIEMELSSLPKVKSLNLSYSLAELLTKESFREKLGKLTKAFYKIKGLGSVNLLVEFLERLIEGKRDYSYLFKLFKHYLTKDKEKGFLTVGYYPIHLQYLNLCLYEAKANLEEKMEKRITELSEEELWKLFFSGKRLRETLKGKGAENKINSLAFKLLNALKTGDSHRFMDIILRVYAGLSLKVPQNFVKTIENKEAFKSAGYSFVAGLLNEGKGEEDGKQ